jgi:hypothetical protein
MQRSPYPRTQIGFRLSGWRAALALGLGLAIIVGIIVFAMGLLLVVAPILLVGSVLYYFFGSKTRVFGAADESAAENIIDGDFSVVEKPVETPKAQK